MTDELRLVLVFVACILSAYSIGVSHGRAATYRTVLGMMDEIIALTGEEEREAR